MKLKVIILSAFFLTLFLSYFVNSAPAGTDRAIGFDEQAYIGASNRMVLFQNKELTIWYPKPALLIPYVFGQIQKASGMPIEAVFRIAHILLVLLTTWAMYALGSLFNRRTGLLMALFTGLYYSSSFWLGVAYMVPSSLTILLLASAARAMLLRRWLLVFTLVVVSFFCYWWITLPLCMVLGMTWLLVHRYYRMFLIATTAAILFFITFVAQKAADLIGAQSYGGWFNEALTSILSLYALAAILLPFLILRWKKHNPIFRSLLYLSLSSIVINIALSIMISDIAQVRSIAFLFFGVFMLYALAYESARQQISYRVRQTALASGIIVLGIIVPLHLQSDVFRGRSFAPDERNFLTWVSNELPESSAFLADYPTMLTTTFFVNNRNYLLLEKPPQIDYHELAEFFHEKAWSQNDLTLLSTIITKENIESFYLVVTPRTRWWVSNTINRKVPIYSLEIDSTTYPNYPSLDGEEKFDKTHWLDSVYRKDGFTVWKINVEGLFSTLDRTRRIAPSANAVNTDFD